MADAHVRGATPADALDSPAAQEQWRRSVASPPSPPHRVLVAMTGGQVRLHAAIGLAA